MSEWKDRPDCEGFWWRERDGKIFGCFAARKRGLNIEVNVSGGWCLSFVDSRWKYEPNPPQPEVKLPTVATAFRCNIDGREDMIGYFIPGRVEVIGYDKNGFRRTMLRESMAERAKNLTWLT